MPEQNTSENTTTNSEVMNQGFCLFLKATSLHKHQFFRILNTSFQFPLQSWAILFFIPSYQQKRVRITLNSKASARTMEQHVDGVH